MVSFNRKSSSSYGSFHDVFTKSNMIHNWFHYIKSSYIVASNYTSDEISELFTKCAKDNNVPTTHLVVEVNLSNRQGMLVEDAWKWLKRNSKG